MWDSKYTTNINTEMNYWPAEVGNLAECAEPLFRMIRELTDQGSQVARRTTAPAAGSSTEHRPLAGRRTHGRTELGDVHGGRGLAGDAPVGTLLVHGRQDVPRRVLSHPQGKRRILPRFPRPAPAIRLARDQSLDLPENFPAVPGQTRLRRDHDLPDDDPRSAPARPSTWPSSTSSSAPSPRPPTSSASTGTSRPGSWRPDPNWRPCRSAEGQPPGMARGLDETEKSHRHISGLWGLFPGRQISARRTPKFAEGSKVVLEQRGLPGNGWASAWKAACWAASGTGPRPWRTSPTPCANTRRTACSRSAHARCRSTDLSACPRPWPRCSFNRTRKSWSSCRRCRPRGRTATSRFVARGGLRGRPALEDGRITEATLHSKLGRPCQVRSAVSPEGDRPAPVRARPPAGTGSDRVQDRTGRHLCIDARGR